MIEASKQFYLLIKDGVLGVIADVGFGATTCPLRISPGYPFTHLKRLGS